LALDYLFSSMQIDPKSLVHMGEEAGVFAIISSVVLWGLMIYCFVQPYFKKEEESCCN